MPGSFCMARRRSSSESIVCGGDEEPEERKEQSSVRYCALGRRAVNKPVAIKD